VVVRTIPTTTTTDKQLGWLSEPVVIGPVPKPKRAEALRNSFAIPAAIGSRSSKPTTKPATPPTRRPAICPALIQTHADARPDAKIKATQAGEPKAKEGHRVFDPCVETTSIGTVSVDAVEEQPGHERVLLMEPTNQRLGQVRDRAPLAQVVSSLPGNRGPRNSQRRINLLESCAPNLRFDHPSVGTPSKIDPMSLANPAKPGAQRSPYDQPAKLSETAKEVR
jgi:hypothetical protein